jgi:hypothetical protein
MTITMAAATAAALVGSGAQLGVMAAVQSSDRETLPVLWLQTASYSETTIVGVPGALAAYTSQDPPVAGETITPGFSVTMSPGELLTVDSPAGTGQVTDSALVPTALAVLNATTTQLTTGVAQVREDGSSGAICAAPLYGNAVQVIVPLAKFLLVFSSVSAAPGTVVRTLYGPALLLDMTGVPARTVSFDINAGWSWGGYSWAQAVSAASDIVPLLVEPSPALADAAARLQEEHEPSDETPPE